MDKVFQKPSAVLRIVNVYGCRFVLGMTIVQINFILVVILTMNGIRLDDQDMTSLERLLH